MFRRQCPVPVQIANHAHAQRWSREHTSGTVQVPATPRCLAEGLAVVSRYLVHK